MNYPFNILSICMYMCKRMRVVLITDNRNASLACVQNGNNDRLLIWRLIKASWSLWGLRVPLHTSMGNSSPFCPQQQAWWELAAVSLSLFWFLSRGPSFLNIYVMCVCVWQGLLREWADILCVTGITFSRALHSFPSSSPHTILSFTLIKTEHCVCVCVCVCVCFYT